MSFTDCLASRAVHAYLGHLPDVAIEAILNELAQSPMSLSRKSVLIRHVLFTQTLESAAALTRGGELASITRS